jgi:hypothetical protein
MRHGRGKHERTPVPLPPDTPERWRARQVRKLRARLERNGFPRLEMFLLVGVTGMAGLVASWALRLAGVAHMGWRYLLALGVAYAVFLLLLRAWMQARPGDQLELPDLPEASLRDKGDLPELFEGGGGDFGGGGASGSFDAMPSLDVPDTVLESGLDAGLDGEGCAIPLVLLAVLAAVVLAALTVVWSAPTLFAELLLDGVLAAGLYRRLRRAPAGHWLETALRRTAWPFLATCVLVAGTGFALQALVPGADTLGTALEGLQARRD